MDCGLSLNDIVFEKMIILELVYNNLWGSSKSYNFEFILLVKFVIGGSSSEDDVIVVDVLFLMYGDNLGLEFYYKEFEVSFIF